jgi:parvulin-like peptidyl-prolyl isomerase
VLAAVAVCLGGAVRADILEQVLVKVNGEIITKTEFEARQVSFLRQRSQQYRNLQGDEDLRKAISEITPELIAEAVDEMLLVQRAKELGLRLTDERFKEVLTNIKKENKLESEEQFQAALAQEGLTLADLRRSLERQMLINGVQQREVWNKVGVSEEEARQYYEQHREEFTSPPSVMLREIAVDIPGAADAKTASAAEVEAARSRVEEARKRILGGEDFARVAADLSTSATSANGGLIGPLNRADIAPALLTIIDGLKPGEMSEPLRTARGFQLLKLESMTPAQARPFESAREDIANRVFEVKRRAELRKYVKRLREQAIIEWKNEELRKAFDRHHATTAQSTDR